MECLSNVDETELSVDLQITSPHVFALVKDCHLQSASCYIHLDEFGEAINFLNAVLEIEPDNYRALYLRGCAKKGLAKKDSSCLQGAVADL